MIDEPLGATLERLLDLKTVLAHVPLSKQHIYRKIADGSFPAPLRIGKARIAWRQSDIVSWMAAQSQIAPKAEPCAA